jgi:hypothetical protein
MPKRTLDPLQQLSLCMTTKSSALASRPSLQPSQAPALIQLPVSPQPVDSASWTPTVPGVLATLRLYSFCVYHYSLICGWGDASRMPKRAPDPETKRN